jgi:Arabinose-binding domain of AraC transcription regulator, N-term
MESRVRADLDRLPTKGIEREHRVRAFTLHGLRELLRDYGLDHGPVLEEAGLTAEAVEDGLGWISLEKLATALTVGSRVTGDRYFGLKHGASGRFTSNPLGYLLANAPDLKTGRPVAVGMTHRQPADIGEYEKRFCPRLSFDQPVNSITITAATLALPMPNADPQLFKLVNRYCEEEIERQKAIDHPLNRISRDDDPLPTAG